MVPAAPLASARPGCQEVGRYWQGSDNDQERRPKLACDDGAKETCEELEDVGQDLGKLYSTAGYLRTFGKYFHTRKTRSSIQTRSARNCFILLHDIHWYRERRRPTYARHIRSSVDSVRRTAWKLKKKKISQHHGRYLVDELRELDAHCKHRANLSSSISGQISVPFSSKNRVISRSLTASGEDGIVTDPCRTRDACTNFGICINRKQKASASSVQTHGI